MTVSTTKVSDLSDDSLRVENVTISTQLGNVPHMFLIAWCTNSVQFISVQLSSVREFLFVYS